MGSSNNITVGKVVNGTDTVLHTGSAGVSAGTWYNLRVIVKGDLITVKRYGFAYWRVANEAQITNIIVNKPLGNAFSIGYCGMWTPQGSANVHFNLVGIGSQDYNYTIANNTFTLTSGSQGNIKGLYVNNGVNTNMNFVSNEDQIRVEMGINRYLGELKFKYQVGTGTIATASTPNRPALRTIASFTVVARRKSDWNEDAMPCCPEHRQSGLLSGPEKIAPQPFGPDFLSKEHRNTVFALNPIVLKTPPEPARLL